MPRTALYELVSARLGQDVCEWCAQRRREDPGIGWRTLTEELRERTGRRFSHASLASWCKTPEGD